MHPALYRLTGGGRTLVGKVQPLGHAAPYDDWAPHSPRPQRHPRLSEGPNLITLAMNGWADGEPAWWLNLQAHPNARVDLRRALFGQSTRSSGTGAVPPVGQVA